MNHLLRYFGCEPMTMKELLFSSFAIVTIFIAFMGYILFIY